MRWDPIVVQSAISLPLALAFTVYSLTRKDRSRLHVGAACLVMCAGLWILSLSLRRLSSDPIVSAIALHLEMLTSTFAGPFFLVSMGFFTRHPAFTEGRGALATVFSLYGAFYLVFLTNPWHGLLIADPRSALAGEHPTQWAGPLFWVQQVWVLLADVLGFALCAYAVRHARTRDERRRPLLVIAGVLCPVVAHLLFLAHWQPFDFTLAPAASGLAILLFARGIPHHGLLEAQPIVRGDLIEHLPDALVLADAAGAVLDANVAAEAILGRSRSDLRGKPLAEVFAALAVGDEGNALAARVTSLPLVGARVQGELHTRAGRHLEVTAGAVGALGSHPAGRFVAFHDRTVQRENEQRFRERQKLESAGILAAGVAHEINNPLAFVRANLGHIRELSDRLVKLARIDPACPDADLLELDEILTDSVEGVERIARIVDDMLRFTRVHQAARDELSVNDVVREALRLAAFDRQNAVRVETCLAEGLPLVRGSANRLVQVLLNLLLNANRALADRADACVVVETARSGHQVKIRVRDNGPGVPEEHRDRIFDPFFTTSAPGQGTGLGLSIASDIIREHGGTLALDAPHEDGATFTIQLPSA
jgi:two-component system sensor histidine kinase HupT/HoxJ